MAVVDLVSGFLGAGKTTFILPYVAWLKAQGRRPVVVENEFGFINVDSAILRQDDIEVAELSGGCLCCGLKAAFRDLLLRLAKTDAWIVVEPSGIFNPRDFFSVMAEPEVHAVCRIGMVATVVEPHSLAGPKPQSAGIFHDQLNTAGVVLLSKTGGMDGAEWLEAATRLEALRDAPSEGRIETRPWDQFGDGDFARFSQAGYFLPAGDGVFQDHAALYESLVIRSDKPLAEEEVRTAIDAVRRTAGDVIRLKGFVPRRNGGFWQVNGTADGCELREVEGARAFLVAIGRGLERKTIERHFMKKPDAFPRMRPA